MILHKNYNYWYVYSLFNYRKHQQIANSKEITKKIEKKTANSKEITTIH